MTLYSCILNCLDPWSASIQSQWGQFLKPYFWDGEFAGEWGWLHGQKGHKYSSSLVFWMDSTHSRGGGSWERCSKTGVAAWVVSECDGMSLRKQQNTLQTNPILLRTTKFSKRKYHCEKLIPPCWQVKMVKKVPPLTLCGCTSSRHGWNKSENSKACCSEIMKLDLDVFIHSISYSTQ